MVNVVRPCYEKYPVYSVLKLTSTGGILWTRLTFIIIRAAEHVTSTVVPA